MIVNPSKGIITFWNLNEEIKSFVTPNQYFNVKFRGIFTKHTSGTESKRWLTGPNISHWPQQLNFTVWCTTIGCGISREVLNKVQNRSRHF